MFPYDETLPLTENPQRGVSAVVLDIINKFRTE